MSMLNDIDWIRKGNDEICTSNSEKVKTYAKKFSQGTLDVPRSWRRKQVVWKKQITLLKQSGFQ